MHGKPLQWGCKHVAVPREHAHRVGCVGCCVLCGLTVEAAVCGIPQ